jgi:D-tyrosyl-tRNA(Tyr) deacylase
VEKAGVTVNGQTISVIGAGLLVFLGVEHGDGFADADYLLEKINNLRIFEDSEGKMNLSLLDVAGEMLIVSQFTLLGDCRKGRRPSFAAAEEPKQAKLLYDYFFAQAQGNIGRVAGGEFQAMMKVELINDGPVTIIMDSKKNK